MPAFRPAFIYYMNAKTAFVNLFAREKVNKKAVKHILLLSTS